ncbi:hypothetical protein [Planktotalea sp.]|uniref:hypothetical protein n=1 Tax=Planktotalea sp. TaxID=2029877 RepID=UPI003D6B3B1D
MKIYLSLLIWVFSALAVLAQVLGDSNPNRFYSAQSATYRSWAPKFGPSGGGIIFGKGEAEILIGDLEVNSPAQPTELDLRINEGGRLSIIAGDAAEYEVPAHFFAVCPMARHVQRDAPLGFTIPPYLDPDTLEEAQLTKYLDGYVAEEFIDDQRMANLVREADFWPDNFFRSRYFLTEDTKNAILADVNSVAVSVEGFSRNTGFTYITGDFHLRSKILLAPSSDSALFFGFPLTYYQRNVGAKMEVSDLAIMAGHPDIPLTSDFTKFFSSDFKSLYDLAATFVFFRDFAPDTLVSFISRECPTAPLQ